VDDVDTVRLRDGILVIDTRDRNPIAVAMADTTIEVTNGRAEVVASGSSVVSVRALAGSVDRVRGDSRVAISGRWSPPAGRDTSLAAFRAGWRSLRDGRNGDAKLAFDPATDPVVAEEASFWAAVAADRNGDPETAIRRFERFLDDYPDSTRAEAARAALAHLR